MKTKRIEFHTLRYPAHLAKSAQLSRAHLEELYAEVISRRNNHSCEEFLRWSAEHNTAIESPAFRTLYAARKKQEQAKRTLFHNLHSISEHHCLALRFLGGFVSFLYKTHTDCQDTIELTRTFIVEIAIFDAAFVGAYAGVLEGEEFLDWVENIPPYEPMMAEDHADSTAADAWAKEDGVDDHLNEAKLRVEHKELSSEQLNLLHEEKKRLARSNHDLEYDLERSCIIHEHIAENMQLKAYPPVSFAGIKDTLKKWDDAGRHLGWHPLVNRRRQENERFISWLADGLKVNSDDDNNFAETLWTEREFNWHQFQW